MTATTTTTTTMMMMKMLMMMMKMLMMMMVVVVMRQQRRRWVGRLQRVAPEQRAQARCRMTPGSGTATRRRRGTRNCSRCSNKPSTDCAPPCWPPWRAACLWPAHMGTGRTSQTHVVTAPVFQSQGIGHNATASCDDANLKDTGSANGQVRYHAAELLTNTQATHILSSPLLFLSPSPPPPPPQPPPTRRHWSHA